MTLTLDLNPEIENCLLAQAQAKGVSLADYARDVLAREARSELSPSPSPASKSLLQFFRESPLVGLELEFERDQDTGRDIVL